MTTPLIVEEDNLSVAWAVAFLRAIEPGVRGIAPLVVNVTGFRDGDPQEVPDIRECLDGTLMGLKRSLPNGAGRHLYNSNTNANLICPYFWYERAGHDRRAFFDKFRRVYPALRGCNPLNRHGTYFGRMVDDGRSPEAGNQLEHIIKNYVERGVSRPTAMVVDVFDAARDHTTQTRRGFPCLNRVGFTVLGKNKDQLGVTATYPTQYLFERGYGNYLGLCQLGKFMARELGLKLTQFTCTVDIAVLGDVAKSHLRGLEATLRAAPAVQAALAARQAAGVPEEAYAHVG